MRCTCCDVELTDFESTRKSKSNEEYLDMCNNCYKYIEEDVPTTIRRDLANKQELLSINSDDDTDIN